MAVPNLCSIPLSVLQGSPCGTPQCRSAVDSHHSRLCFLRDCDPRWTLICLQTYLGT